MTVEHKILAAVRGIAARKPRGVREVERGQRLIADLGLDSMDLAELVAVLEVEVGRDPFAERAAIADIHTVGDLIDVYLRE